MGSNYDDIRATLENHLNSNFSSFPIAWENISYEPDTGTSYLSTKFIPTRRRPAVRGLNPQQRYQGIYRVIAYAPEGSGPGAADALADAILASFDATTDISYLTTTVSIDYAERSQGYSIPNWYYVVCDIGWYHYN